VSRLILLYTPPVFVGVLRRRGWADAGGVDENMGMADTVAALPDGYPDFPAGLKTRVRDAQVRGQHVVNTQLIELYWQSCIGRSATRFCRSKKLERGEW
jgi:hypothetical protein